MKYKLKKWYPSLPKRLKEGAIVWRPRFKRHWGYIENNLAMSGTDIPVEEVENNPEFWEEIRLFYQPVMPDNEKELPGNLYSFEVYQNKENCEKDWPGCPIKTYEEGDIEEPTIVDCDSIIYPEDQEDCSCKKPLFTTEDGVHIYKGNKYCVVHKETHEMVENWANEDLKGENPHYFYFSNATKANEWVKENKPRYSKKDIKESIKRIEEDLPYKIPTRAILKQLECE